MLPVTVMQVLFWISLCMGTLRLGEVQLLPRVPRLVLGEAEVTLNTEDSRSWLHGPPSETQLSHSQTGSGLFPGAILRLAGQLDIEK